MKKIIIIIALSVMGLALNAQDKKFQYQGEVNVGYAFCLELDSNDLMVEVLNGIRFNKYFYGGFGTGLMALTSDEAVYVPLYVNLRGYLPVKPKFNLVFGSDFGTRLDYAYGTSGGFLLRPEFGVRFDLGKKMGLNIMLKYERYAWTETVTDDPWTDDVLEHASWKMKENRIGIKLGFEF